MKHCFVRSRISISSGPAKNSRSSAVLVFLGGLFSARFIAATLGPFFRVRTRTEELRFEAAAKTEQGPKNPRRPSGKESVAYSELGCENCWQCGEFRARNQSFAIDLVNERTPGVKEKRVGDNWGHQFLV